MIADTALRSQELQARLPQLSFLSLDAPRKTVAAKIECLDKLIPDGGIATGSFVEILSAGEGAGSFSLALTLARQTLPRREAWAVVDADGSFYPPAAAALGGDLKRLILLRSRAADDAWAFTQLLRSLDIAACFWTTRRMDNMIFRRLQLAAERGDGLGFVMRPAAAERKPCWATLRLMASRRCTADGPRLCVRVLHAKGRLVNASEEVEVAA